MGAITFRTTMLIATLLSTPISLAVDFDKTILVHGSDVSFIQNDDSNYVIFPLDSVNIIRYSHQAYKDIKILQPDELPILWDISHDSIYKENLPKGSLLTDNSYYNVKIKNKPELSDDQIVFETDNPIDETSADNDTDTWYLIIEGVGKTNFRPDEIISRARH